jgi:hypothetical protein
MLIVSPLFGQRLTADPKLSAEEVLRQKKERRTVMRRHVKNPGLRELFNLLERKAFDLQAAAIQPGADAHAQGQAYGAGYIYQVCRAVFEGQEIDDDEEEQG